MQPAVRARSALLPAGALAAVLVLDLLLATRSRPAPVPVLALLDEPAHLLTAWLVIAAWTTRTTALPALPWVLAGAVLLDLDHVPLYLGLDVTATQSGRPVTHSLTTVAALLVAALAVRRGRGALAGLAVGTATQLLRDLVSGPGVPLLWPALPVDVRLPYAAYLGALVVLTGAATARRVSGRADRAAAHA